MDQDGFYAIYSPPCNTCKHYKPEEDYPSCTAFKRIPDPILLGEVDHREPVRGDHGIMWEAK